jgi:hypothetical protein
MMTSNDIRAALERRYAPPEWALFHEVHDRTGSHQRSADVVAMNLYRSRGLEIHGFEIKVYRGDLLRELREPVKAENIGQFCDRWWLAVPADMEVKRDEVPASWGLIRVKGDECRVKWQAQKLPSIPLTRDFVAAMLRRAASAAAQLASITQKVADVDKALGVEWEKGVEFGRTDMARQTEYMKQQLAAVDRFQKETGIRIEDRWRYGNISAVVQALSMLSDQDNGLRSAHAQLVHIRDTVTNSVAVLDKLMAIELQIQPKAEKKQT